MVSGGKVNMSGRWWMVVTIQIYLIASEPNGF